jgi:protein TonB
MFNNLIESQAKAQKRSGGTAFSVVFHVILITAAVKGTLSANSHFDKVKEQKVEFVQVKKEEPPPPKDEVKPPPDIVAAPPPPKGFQILTAPIKIPDVIPEIDLNKQVTREEDFTGKGAAGGTSRGVVGGVAVPLNDQPLFDFQVEKPAAASPSNQPPNYPNQLRAANIEGQVVAKFVVDTNGRADMRTFEIIKSDHDLFTNAVRNSLPNFRFFPAELGGRKVKQLVQMPFVFSLSK